MNRFELGRESGFDVLKRRNKADESDNRRQTKRLSIVAIQSGAIRSEKAFDCLICLFDKKKKSIGEWLFCCF
jgi:hypothetical protein